MNNETESKKQKLRHKKQELKRIREEQRNAKHQDKAERAVHRRRKKATQQEIFQLEMEISDSPHVDYATDGQAAPSAVGGAVTGALPDFAVVGGKKCGTTFFYHLLSQHPLVEPAAAKELHYFDLLFEEKDTEWYRRCFPAPKRKDGQTTLTGEATPYMANRHVPERMAQVVPQARLIALLRNPVHRAYSDYQQVASKGREPRTFEEAVGLEGGVGGRETRPLGEGGEASERAVRTCGFVNDSEYLFRGIYVDQLLRWSEFFAREQMLVLKSEDFFERPHETLRPVLEFLGLPEWEPEAPELRDKRDERKYDRRKRKKGRYEGGMAAATRRRLEEYFEPHNRRLYEYLGKDLGW